MFSISSEGFSIAIYAHTPLAVYLFNVSVLINNKVMGVCVTFLPIFRSKYKLNQIMPPFQFNKMKYFLLKTAAAVI